MSILDSLEMSTWSLSALEVELVIEAFLPSKLIDTIFVGLTSTYKNGTPKRGRR